MVRHVLPGPPVGVEYELTRQGHELEPVVRDLTVWAERWLPQPEVAPAPDCLP